MARIGSALITAIVVALALVGAAAAVSPDVSAMNLQAGDVPGGKIVSQGAVKDKHYLAAYHRTFRFAAPSGSSGLLILEVATRLGATAAVATADVASTEKALRSSAGRKGFIAVVAEGFKVKAKAVTMSPLRRIAGYDQGFEVPLSVKLKGGRVYESVVSLRLDRVAVIMFEIGVRSIKAANTVKYATAIAGHIGTQLTPVGVSPPTVTGTALQGQTLTATPGTWSAPEATFTYQWRHCDPAGANCVDVPGATAQTYAVTPADVGSTLVVVVTASNRFGSLAAPSAATAVAS